MIDNNTKQRLEAITDAGLFEELATAILRERDSRCRRLSHVGVNACGRTVKSPSDGIGYVSDEGSLRMLAVYHTTCRPADLRRKWLAEPDGDLQRTLLVFRRQKNRIPELTGTLIGTTNREPREELVHDLQAAGHEAGIDVEVYPGSAIAHFLDTEPRGQWLRQKYLGVQQTRLSKNLLRDLSEQSIATGMADADSWVRRDFDDRIADHSRYVVTFVVGESGMGKTVACRKCLESHVRDGGFGLTITAKVLGTSHTLADAVDATLRKLHPPLVLGEGREALSLASETAPLLLVVDDINRSASPAGLLEKLVSWGKAVQKSNERSAWRVLCPVWPRTIALLSDKTQGWVNNLSISLSRFSEEEGIAAVQRHRSEPLPVLDAKAIATNLGYDPLLIALHGDGDSTPQPTTVIRSFVDLRLGNLAAAEGTYTAGEYRLTLRSLSLQLLERKELEPTLIDVVKWLGEQSAAVNMIREIVRSGNVAQLVGPLERERVVFRHDRVRDHLLADAVTDALLKGELSQSVMSDPFFAEVLGLALAGSGAMIVDVDQVATANPLALFSAMRHFRQPRTQAQRHIIDASMAWADDVPRNPQNGFIRQAVLRVLSECEGPHVGPLSERIDDSGTEWWALRARFRNGDISAGIRLCGRFEPGLRVVGHVELIEHVFCRYGAAIMSTLNTELQKSDLNLGERSGALRLAGFIGTPSLATALRESWRIDRERHELLSDYFWACSRCCGDEPNELLGPILDEWAALPENDHDGTRSPRTEFGANHIRWAFLDMVPNRAIGYFIEQAMRPELRWPLLVMLNGIDNPDAVEFLVRELARLDEEWEGTDRWSPFSRLAVEEWSRRRAAPMQPEARRRLRDLWSSHSNGRHLRRRALQFWCATVRRADIAALQTIDINSAVGDVALFGRLRRGDVTAIPNLLERLEGDNSTYWWQAGRYIWSAELTECLDRALGRTAKQASERGGSQGIDWLLSERLAALPHTTAERLIKKHWVGLSHSPHYVQAALYVASPDLLQKVRDVVRQCENPKSLFQFLDHVFAMRVEGRPGITRLAQMEALLPYLDHLSESDIFSLWKACNENGWFDWRRAHLDSRAELAGRRFVNNASALKELDKELARRGPHFWLDHWAESLVKRGVSLDDMMALVRGWLERNGEEKALHMAVDLVTRFGRRRHLALLHCHKSAQSETGAAIIEDASFQLRFRSLQ